MIGEEHLTVVWQDFGREVKGGGATTAGGHGAGRCGSCKAPTGLLPSRGSDGWGVILCRLGDGERLSADDWEMEVSTGGANLVSKVSED